MEPPRPRAQTLRSIRALGERGSFPSSKKQDKYQKETRIDFDYTGNKNIVCPNSSIGHPVPPAKEDTHTHTHVHASFFGVKFD